MSLAYATIAYVNAEIAALKAWVEAKLYLPKADLPEYMISASVTGDIVPDATCRYFRGGDHNGQPYYQRPDGSWFIWWDGDAIWFISDTLGSLAGGYWSRVDPNVEGNYPIRFLTAGIPVVTLGSKYLINGFIDRGDPAAPDFVHANFTRDGAWHDLDLSAIVPAGAKSVSIHGEFLSGLVQKYMLLRAKGNANEENISGVRVQVGNSFQHKDWVVPLDADRFIQYKTNWVIIGLLDITVKGWWF